MMSVLPSDALLNMLSFLSPAELLSTSAINHSLLNIHLNYDQILWQHFIEELFRTKPFQSNLLPSLLEKLHRMRVDLSSTDARHPKNYKILFETDFDQEFVLSPYWKIAFFHYYKDLCRENITIHELCSIPWAFRFKQYYIQGEFWHCQFHHDFTVTSDLHDEVLNWRVRFISKYSL